MPATVLIGYPLLEIGGVGAADNNFFGGFYCQVYGEPAVEPEGEVAYRVARYYILAVGTVKVVWVEHRIELVQRTVDVYLPLVVTYYPYYLVFGIYIGYLFYRKGYQLFAGGNEQRR